MWQKPHCLLPHEVVMAAYDSGVRLAHHVDIGAAHVRNNLDLAWVDHVIGAIGGRALPRMMHVEAIMWAAIAMRFGGGYLDPDHWHCWHNRQWKRMARILGVSGPRLLRVEKWRRMKCFHGGGHAKWWIASALEAGWIGAPGELRESKPPMPFEELTRNKYLSGQRLKALVRKAGYYRLVKS